MRPASAGRLLFLSLNVNGPPAMLIAGGATRGRQVVDHRPAEVRLREAPRAGAQKRPRRLPGGATHRQGGVEKVRGVGRRAGAEAGRPMTAARSRPVSGPRSGPVKPATAEIDPADLHALSRAMAA